MQELGRGVVAYLNRSRLRQNVHTQHWSSTACKKWSTVENICTGDGEGKMRGHRYNCVMFIQTTQLKIFMITEGRFLRAKKNE